MNVRGGGWCNPQAGAKRPVRMRAMGRSKPDDASPDNPPPDNLPIDKEALKQRMQALQSEMAAIDKQLDEMEEAEEEETESDPL